MVLFLKKHVRRKHAQYSHFGLENDSVPHIDVARLSTRNTTEIHFVCTIRNNYSCINTMNSIIKRRWSSGRILACHAGDPGSIPGRRIFFTTQNYYIVYT